MVGAVCVEVATVDHRNAATRQALDTRPGFHRPANASLTDFCENRPPMLTDESNSATPAARLAVKVVPGAKRDEIVGPHGDRLKVRVSAPPEDGKANKAVCALLAEALGVKRSAVTVIVGPSSPEKTIRIDGLSAADVLRKLNLG